MNQSNDRNDPERDHLARTGLTWADVRDQLRKTLSEPPREHRVVKRCRHPHCDRDRCAMDQLAQAVQLPRTPQPVSFLRWCGEPGVHSAHGRCDGVK
jgi:hypothetical protein